MYLDNILPKKGFEYESYVGAFSPEEYNLNCVIIIFENYNGTEFKNAIVDSLFKSMGVRVRTGAF